MTTDDSAEEPTQISVAELLARNGRKDGVTSSESGGRRRRGVAGGITVAELTGELPVVTRAEPQEVQPEPAPKREPAPEPEPAPDTQREPVEQKPAAYQPNRRYKPDPSPDPKPEQQARPRPTAWSSQSEPELLAGSPTSSGLLGRREPERPGESTEVIGGFGSTRAPVERSWMTRKPDNQPQQLDEPDTDHVEVEKSHDFGRTRAFENGAPKTEPPKIESPKIEPLETEVAETVSAAEAETNTDTEPKTENDTNARQWLVLAGQAVAAIVVGALLFKGFERLWDMLPWVALVLAVLVILGLVALVRILRKTDDLLSIVIAIVVGVFVTMGPLVFLLSTS